MSKYDNLNPRTELEQFISRDLKKALGKRECEIKHNGTETSCAGGNKTDIEIWTKTHIVSVEVTKRKNPNKTMNISL